MITHEEAKEAYTRLFESQLDGFFAPFPTRSDLDTISLYIKQQEKITQLLGLYCEHHKLVPFTPGLGDKSKRVLDISIEIKQLEKELGEMK